MLAKPTLLVIVIFVAIADNHAQNEYKGIEDTGSEIDGTGDDLNWTQVSDEFLGESVSSFTNEIQHAPRFLLDTDIDSPLKDQVGHHLGVIGSVVKPALSKVVGLVSKKLVNSHSKLARLVDILIDLFYKLNATNVHQMAIVVKNLTETIGRGLKSAGNSITEIENKRNSSDNLSTMEKQYLLTNINSVLNYLHVFKMKLQSCLDAGHKASVRETGSIKTKVDSALKKLDSQMEKIDNKTSTAIVIRNILDGGETAAEDSGPNVTEPTTEAATGEKRDTTTEEFSVDYVSNVNVDKNSSQTDENKTKPNQSESVESSGGPTTQARVSETVGKEDNKEVNKENNKEVNQTKVSDEEMNIEKSRTSLNDTSKEYRDKVDHLIVNLNEKKYDKIRNSANQLNKTESKMWTGIANFVTIIKFGLSFATEMTKNNREKYINYVNAVKESLLAINIRLEMALKAAKKAVNAVTKAIKSEIKFVVSALQKGMAQIKTRISELTQTGIKINGGMVVNELSNKILDKNNKTVINDVKGSILKNPIGLPRSVKRKRAGQIRSKSIRNRQGKKRHRKI